MERLTWTRTGDVWRSGPYQIELVGPRLWVLSRKRPTLRPPESATIETSAGSLSTLRHCANEIHRRRRMLRRAVLWATVLVLATVGISMSMVSDWRWAVAVFFVSTVTAFVSLIKLVDSLIGRSWDFVSQAYQ